MLTFFLMFVIVAVATDTRAVGEAAAIAIGATVGLDAMFGGPIPGASMNPARSLGPAIAAPEFSGIWIYLFAPLLGAAVGALAYQFIRGERRARRSCATLTRRRRQRERQARGREERLRGSRGRVYGLIRSHN